MTTVTVGVFFYPHLEAVIQKYFPAYSFPVKATSNLSFTFDYMIKKMTHIIGIEFILKACRVNFTRIIISQIKMDDQLAEKIIYMIKTHWNRSSTGSQKLKNAAIISWVQQPQHRKVAIKSALPNISFHKNSNRRKFPYDHTKRDESRAASTTSPQIRAWVGGQSGKDAASTSLKHHSVKHYYMIHHNLRKKKKKKICIHVIILRSLF